MVSLSVYRSAAWPLMKSPSLRSAWSSPFLLSLRVATRVEIESKVWKRFLTHYKSRRGPMQKPGASSYTLKRLCL